MKSFTIGDYLLCRLSEMGIDHLFGVPGDYNLPFLDHVIDHPTLTWVGCTNELNAAYAADGYARCKPAAALLTTFGVGELSAINGVAGSYAEYLPVIHIVGAPSRKAQRNGDLVHHSLGDGDFHHFARMHQEICVAQASLTPENATEEIDRVLSEVLAQCRPGYLLLPVDVAGAEAKRPQHPLILPEKDNRAVLAAFSDTAEQMLAQARSVSLLADFLADRFEVDTQLSRWMDEVAMPHATLLMGKGVLCEQRRGFVGTYSGAASEDSTRHAIESAEVIITVGVRFTDTLTAGFTQQIAEEHHINIQPFSSRVGDRLFEGLPMHAAVEALYQLCRRYQHGWPQPTTLPPTLPEDEHKGLNQNAFWHAMQTFLQPGDIVLADQGTAAFGIAALRLPENARLLVQPLWGSIGYTLPAAFGAQTADAKRRVIVIIGDGSAQLTVQELSSMMRDALHPIIFLLNNEGYTVERAIHGATQRYNDIAAWNWTQLPQAMSLHCPVQSWRVSETIQLQEVMKAIAISDRMSLVEVMLRQQDLPPLLRAVTASLHQRNAC